MIRPFSKVTWPCAFLMAACSAGSRPAALQSETQEHGDADSTELPGSKPIGVVSGDAVYVVNGGSSSVSVLDASSLATLGTIELTNADYPHHINLDATRAQLVIGIPGMDMSHGHHGGMEGMQGALLVLDAQTGSTVGSRLLDGMNHNGAFSPDGQEIWTALMNSPGTVLVLDRQTLVTKTAITVGNSPAEVTFSKDGRLAFVANGASNSVTVIDVATKAVVKTIAVGIDPVGAWQGSDGLMYVDNEEGKTVVAIDTADLSLPRVYDLGFTPGMAVTAPNGELWVSDGDNGKVTYFKAGSTTKLGDIPTGEGAHAVTFSPDGSRAFVTNQFANSVSVIDATTHKVIKTVSVGTNPNGIVYRAKPSA